MGCRKSTALAAMVLFVCQSGYADFKYSETSKITGGALVGMTKTLGVFSKDARHVMDPTTRTVAVKGNKLRTEESDGHIQIIDLDGRRFIEIDPKTKTYGIATFDDMKKAMEQKRAEMEAKMKEEQAKHGNEPQANLKITPKFESTETGATKTLLGLSAKEVKAKMEMTMESTDPKTQGQQMTTVVNADQWIAPEVPGYSEIRDFYMKMAKELDWIPGQMMGAMANSNIQLSMSELRKSNLAHITGMPMLVYTSMSMAGNGQNPGAQQQAAQPQPQGQPQQSDDSSIPTSPQDMLSKSLGGMFHKKQKQQQQQDAQTTNPASTPGSLMEMQSEVTAYSSDSLDSSLFAPPAGYTEKQVTADDMMNAGRH